MMRPQRPFAGAPLLLGGGGGLDVTACPTNTAPDVSLVSALETSKSYTFSAFSIFSERLQMRGGEMAAVDFYEPCGGEHKKADNTAVVCHLDHILRRISRRYDKRRHVNFTSRTFNLRAEVAESITSSCSFPSSSPCSSRESSTLPSGNSYHCEYSFHHPQLAEIEGAT